MPSTPTSWTTAAPSRSTVTGADLQFAIRASGKKSEINRLILNLSPELVLRLGWKDKQPLKFQVSTMPKAGEVLAAGTLCRLVAASGEGSKGLRLEAPAWRGCWEVSVTGDLAKIWGSDCYRMFPLTIVEAKADALVFEFPDLSEDTP